MNIEFEFCYFRVFVTVIRIFTALNCINFIILKCKPKASVTPDEPPNTFRMNNLAENPTLLSDSQLIFIVTILSMSSIPPLFIRDRRTANTLILSGVPFQLTMGIIVPSVIYFLNPNLRHFIWSELIPDNFKLLYKSCITKLKRPKKIEKAEETEVQNEELATKSFQSLKVTQEIIQDCQPSTSTRETCHCQLRLHLKIAAESNVSTFQLE